MKNLRIILPLFIILFVSLQKRSLADNIRDSVVKVFVTSNSDDYYRPWQSRGSQSASGSGVVIGGNRIVTNAHVVANPTFIQVRKESDPTKYTATLEAIGHDCDLAILNVKDEEFFKNTEPLQFGGLPQLQDQVIVLGFPQGGDKLSITEGVVSRIEIIPYSQSSKKLLAVQIDAAVNLGNSGGPVIQDGKIVGIAMQVISSGQNIGYMIPTPIIHHFLSDLNDGRYDGFPTLGVDFSGTENKTLREYFKLDNQKGGVLVTRVLPFSSAYKRIREGDVILEVNGVPIGVDGTFEFRENERLSFSHLIQEKQVGEDVEIALIRSGDKKNVKVQFTPFVNLIPHPSYFLKPSYYIYGGLVFTVLSGDLLQSWGNRWWEKAPLNFLHYLIGMGRFNKEKKKEIVVLLNVLPDDINVGYHDYSNEVVTKVNSQSFISFEGFVKIMESNKDRYTIFQTDDLQTIILNTENIRETTKDILQRNNIPYQYSEDVAGWLGKQDERLNN